MSKEYNDYWNTWRKPIRNYLMGAGAFLTTLVIAHAYLVTHWG